MSWDTFDDIRHNSMGVFEGVGAADVDAVTHKTLPDGLGLEFMCQGCGKQRVLVLDYAELVAMLFGFSPKDAFRGRPDLCAEPSHWTYRQHPENAWGPHMRCNTGICDYHYPIRISERELRSYLGEAKRQKFLDPRGEGIIVQHCQRLAGQGLQRQSPGARRR